MDTIHYNLNKHWEHLKNDRNSGSVHYNYIKFANKHVSFSSHHSV